MVYILSLIPILLGIVFFIIVYIILRKSSKKWINISLIFVIISSIVILVSSSFNGMAGYNAHIFSNFWIWLTLIFWVLCRYSKRNWLKILGKVLSIIFFVVTVFTVILDVLVDYNIITI